MLLSRSHIKSLNWNLLEFIHLSPPWLKTTTKFWVKHLLTLCWCDFKSVILIWFSVSRAKSRVECLKAIYSSLLLHLWIASTAVIILFNSFNNTTANFYSFSLFLKVLSVNNLFLKVLLWTSNMCIISSTAIVLCI